MGCLFQKAGKFDLYEPKHSGTCRREKGFLDIFLKELLMDNKCHNLSSKGNFKNLIETDAEKSVENIFNLLLVLKLSKKRRSREGDIILVFGKFFNGVGKGDLRVIGAAPDAFAAIYTTFLDDGRFSIVDADGFRGAPFDTIRAPFAFLKVERH
jgi:hypothetical protein